MPLNIKPIAITGPWSSGWALDLHTVSSVFIGDDAFGHPQFENKRSEIGELLYQFKYRGDRSGLTPSVKPPPHSSPGGNSRSKSLSPSRHRTRSAAASLSP